MILEFLSILKHHILKYLGFFVPLKDGPVTIQISDFQIRIIPFHF